MWSALGTVYDWFSASTVDGVPSVLFGFAFFVCLGVGLVLMLFGDDRTRKP